MSRQKNYFILVAIAGVVGTLVYLKVDDYLNSIGVERTLQKLEAATKKHDQAFYACQLLELTGGESNEALDSLIQLSLRDENGKYLESASRILQKFVAKEDRTTEQRLLLFRYDSFLGAHERAKQYFTFEQLNSRFDRERLIRAHAETGNHHFAWRKARPHFEMNPALRVSLLENMARNRVSELKYYLLESAMAIQLSYNPRDAAAKLMTILIRCQPFVAITLLNEAFKQDRTVEFERFRLAASIAAAPYLATHRRKNESINTRLNRNPPVMQRDAWGRKWDIAEAGGFLIIQPPVNSESKLRLLMTHVYFFD